MYNVPDRNLEPPEHETRSAYTCVCCGEHIYVGEDYYDIPGFGICCETCIDDSKRYDAEADDNSDSDYEAYLEFQYESQREEAMLNGEI